MREREDENRTREAGHLDEIQGVVASTLESLRNGGVGFIDWLGLPVLELIMKPNDLPGLPPNSENVIAHAEQRKLLPDGIAIRKLEPSIANSPVPKWRRDLAFCAYGDSNEPVLIERVVLDAHGID